jgi:hypothetical protein
VGRLLPSPDITAFGFIIGKEGFVEPCRRKGAEGEKQGPTLQGTQSRAKLSLNILSHKS